MDFTVIGDNVNLAARLCSIAKAGEVIISENTKKLLSYSDFQLNKLDPVKIKGKEKPIQIYLIK